MQNNKDLITKKIKKKPLHLQIPNSNTQYKRKNEKGKVKEK